MTVVVVSLAFGVIGGLALGGGLWLTLWLRQRRSLGFTVTARRLRLGFSSYDPPNAVPPIASTGFRLLEQKRAVITNVLFGTVGGVGVKAFDFTYNPYSDPRSEQRRSCAAAVLRSSGPSMTLEHESLRTRMLEAVGLHDVELGEAEFDRRFRVRSEQPGAVGGFLGTGLRDWLVSEAPHDLSYEVRDSAVLACGKRRRPEDLDVLLDAVRSFAQRSPGSPVMPGQASSVAGPGMIALVDPTVDMRLCITMGIFGAVLIAAYVAFSEIVGPMM